jgi:hypothetical protein
MSAKELYLNRINIRYLPLYLHNKGGYWIGLLRSKVQTMFRNGEHVDWGSNDILEPHATIRNVEELGAYAASGIITEYITHQFRDRYITEHLTVTFETEEKKRGQVFWNNIELANFWFQGENFGKLTNKWVFNRSAPCIIVGYHVDEAFDNLHELIAHVENTFPHEMYEKYTKGWPIKIGDKFIQKQSK